MLVSLFFMVFVLVLIILILFFLSMKSLKWMESMGSSFECGFSSYFFSRYSFSTHYFLIGLIFLFLDLELCLIMPFFNGENSSPSSEFILFFFIVVLIFGIFVEWNQGKMEWKF